MVGFFLFMVRFGINKNIVALKNPARGRDRIWQRVKESNPYPLQHGIFPFAIIRVVIPTPCGSSSSSDIYKHKKPTIGRDIWHYSMSINPFDTKASFLNIEICHTHNKK